MLFTHNNIYIIILDIRVYTVKINIQNVQVFAQTQSIEIDFVRRYLPKMLEMFGLACTNSHSQIFEFDSSK